MSIVMIVATCVVNVPKASAEQVYTNEPVVYMNNDEALQEAVPAKFPADGVSGIKDKYPSVRNQGNYGTCWAFAALGLAEFDLINKGIYQKDIDLSELQLAYFTYNKSVVDPLGGTSGDTSKFYNENWNVNYLNYGGNFQYAAKRMSQWVGVTNESDVPYGNAADVLNNGVADEYAYNHDVAYLENAYKINIKQNPDEVKRKIMEHGAVGVHYSDCSSAKQYLSYAYYDTSEDYGGGHNVVIVGWDDDYSVDNFSSDRQRPSNNGAWLVRNSQGTDTYNFPYFWMSYESYSLDSYAWVFDFADTDKYDNNYQYDGGLDASPDTYNNIRYAANIFQTQQTSTIEKEELKAVSVSFLNVTDVNYTVDIYTDLTNTKNPLSGTKQASVSGSTKYAGIFTLELPEVVELKPGSYYSVVVSTDKAAVDVDRPVNLVNNFTENKTVLDAKASYAGKSYYSSGGNYYNSYVLGDFCIKAFTSNIPVESSLGDKIGGYTLSLDGTIGVNFYVELPEALINDSDAYMEFTLSDGTVSQVKVSEAYQAEVNDKSYYVFTCRVVAGDMTAGIRAHMVSGNQKGKVYKYTVKQYSDYIIDHPSEYNDYAIAMVKSLLNYGEATQQLFNRNTDKPANDGLSESDKEIQDVDFSGYKYNITPDSVVTGVSYYGSRLNLSSETSLKEYFIIDADDSIDNYTFSYTIGDNESVQLTPWKDNISGKECYGIVIRNIKAYNLDQKIIVTIKKNGVDSEGIKLDYGIFSYAEAVSRMENADEKLVKLTKALYRYCQDAKAYKNSLG